MDSIGHYTITFACYNQLDYTKQFIASLDREEVDFSRIVAVDMEAAVSMAELT